MVDNKRVDAASEFIECAGKLAYTLNEWCETSGVGRSATYEAIKAGQLRAVKRGRRTLILHEDGQTYLRSLPAMEDVAA